MVSVVGTLLALLVFFALFGIFLTQYLPLWMTDNESAFTAQTQSSFASLKSNIDLQLELGGPPVYTTPFVMASQGVPLLAQPTAGTLNFLPVESGVFANVSMTVGPGGSQALYQNYSLGTLSMTLANRYYSGQLFEMEDDAVIQSQSDTQQIVAFPPLLTINGTGSGVGVSIALIQLFGNATQAISTGTQEVASHYDQSQAYVSSGPTGGGLFNAEFKLGTHFPCAWSRYLSQTLNQSGAALSHFTLSPNVCTASNGIAKIVDLKFLNIASFTLVFGAFTIVMGVGVE
ncbi:MAG: hypothetical protein L3K17_06385 [Thermoplasmata archaeon]|nr:hypothetical protein [Thermoplasmata archaeon]